MTENAYQIVTEQVGTFLKEKGYHLETGDLDYFTDGQRAVQIVYDEKTKLLKLRMAALKEGEDVSFRELSAWMLDENTTEKEQQSIANDYIDSLQSAFGIKASLSAQNVEMPTKATKGDTVTVDSFTARFLDIYPQYKPVYKEAVAQYGEFLYDDFFSKYGIEALENILKTGTKKQINKLFSLLSDGFINGDAAVNTIVVYTILGAAFTKSPTLRDMAAPYLDERMYLRDAVGAMTDLLKNEKMRQKYLQD